MLLKLWPRARQALSSRLTLAHIAAGLMIIASGLANARWGYLLGSNGFERTIAITASIAFDIWSAIGFIIMASAATRRKWGQFSAATFAVLLTISYALVAGLSFATTNSEERVAPRRAIERTDQLTTTELNSAVVKLAGLAPARPADELKADMDRILSDRKAGACASMNGPYTRMHCPKYFELKAEHGRSVERSRLEARISELTGTLSKAERVEASDPFEKAMATYLSYAGITLAQGSLIPWTSLLFVVLIVLGGPLVMWLAESHRAVSWAELNLKKNSVDVPEREQTTDEQTVSTDRKVSKLPITPPTNDNRRVVRGKRTPAITPVAARTLKNLEKAGGTIDAKSQNELAIRLGVPRTSFRRVIDQLEDGGMITTSHGANGYNVALAA